MRFVYEVYLELAICCLISLKISDTSSNSATAQWLISIMVSIVLIAFPSFLLYKLFFTVDIRGQYSYSKVSNYQLCCWGIKERSKTFDADEHIV